MTRNPQVIGAQTSKCAYHPPDISEADLFLGGDGGREISADDEMEGCPGDEDLGEIRSERSVGISPVPSVGAFV